MKKKRFALALSFLMLLVAFAGCKQEDVQADVEIYCVSSLEKISKEQEYHGEKFDSLQLSAVRGEYESGQIILRPDRDVSSFEVTASDLTGGGGTISSSQITIYKEHYIPVTDKRNQNEAFPAGEIPDALIPAEYAGAAGEMQIEAGKNQGVWVEIEIPADCTPATYSGTVKIKADLNEYSVPLSLKVYDAVMPETYTAKTAFMLNQDYLMAGELDCSDEMYAAYFEELLKYRITAVSYPGSTESVEAYIESVLKYNDRTSSIFVPHCSTGSGIDKEGVKKYLRALVENTTSERNLLAKAYYYCYDLIDEPLAIAGGLNLVRTVSGQLQEAERELYEELIGEGFFTGKEAGLQQLVETYLLNIPHVLTCEYEESIADCKVTFCPMFDQYDSDASRSTYAAAAGGGEEWWYGCQMPEYPYPSYQIDDYLLGARVVSWMQKDYGVTGNLYWSSALYQGLHLDSNYIAKPVDPYNEPIRIDADRSVNGDGYLFYPGKKYGSPRPFPSMRLHAIRDGMEENELLYALESEYGKLSECYGTEFSAESVSSFLYRKLYYGTQYYTNGAEFLNVREQLLQLLELAQSGVAVTMTEQNGSEKMIVYAPEGTTIEGGDALPSQGFVSATVNSDAQGNLLFAAETESKTISFSSVMLQRKSVADFGGDDWRKDIRVTGENSLETITFEDETVLKAVIKNKYDAERPQDNISYMPSVIVGENLFGAALNDLQEVGFKIYNAGEVALQMSLVLSSPQGDKTVNRYILKPGVWTNVYVGNLSSYRWEHLSSTDMVLFRFTNQYTQDGALPDQVYYLKDFYVSARRAET